jgi:hypothetical protein
MAFRIARFCAWVKVIRISPSAFSSGPCHVLSPAVFEHHGEPVPRSHCWPLASALSGAFGLWLPLVYKHIIKGCTSTRSSWV